MTSKRYSQFFSFILVSFLVTILLAYSNTFGISQQALIDEPHGAAARLRIHLDNPKHHGDITISSLPIYWVNLEKSVDRRTAMETMFAQIESDTSILGVNHTRISAVDVNQTQKMLQDGRLVLNNNLTLVPKDDEMKRRKHRRNEYEYQEGACLLSHLTAILHAHKDGHGTVLILEDDAILSSDFLRYWKAYADLAPDDWNVLQWVTNNEAVLKQGEKLVDPWLTWQPDHFSTRAYMLNHEGMRAILDQTHSIDSEGRDVWILNQPFMLVADTLIYYLAKRTYTSTYPWTGASDLKSTIQSKNHHPTAESLGIAELPSLSLPSRRESILVLMSVRLRSADEIYLEVDRIRLDVKSLCDIHETCEWKIHVVLTNNTLLKPFENAASVLPSAKVNLQVQVSSARFNKFAFVKSHVFEMGKYDYVLLKDNDQRITGFPWASFMEKKKDALVSGPLREVVEESFLRLKMKEPISQIQDAQQVFQFHDALEWKRSGVRSKSSWSTRLFTSAKRLHVPFVEMYFVLLEGSFARWFFSQALTPEFTNQPSDWGVEYLWCPAAIVFNSTQTSCVLVPFVSSHENSRQIAKDGSYVDVGSQALEILRTNPLLDKWMSANDKWETIIKQPGHYNIMKACKKLLAPQPFDLEECARATQSD
jgi:GR25 family glycosyltransferase involved in LPS biosynthesis